MVRWFQSEILADHLLALSLGNWWRHSDVIIIIFVVISSSSMSVRPSVRHISWLAESNALAEAE